MPITRDTPWRDIGPVDLRTWQRVIDAAGGPEGLIREEAWAAAGDHSALALAMLKQESSYGTDFAANPASNFNSLNLKQPTGGGYVRYPNWAAGVTGWRQRITSALYKDGIYARTVTIADLIHVFAPPYDQTKTTTERYITTIVGLMNTWLPGWQPKEAEPVAITFGRVPVPEHEKRLVLNSRAWNDLGVRTIRACAWHRMYGTLWGTDGYFRGAAVDRALTDIGIGVTDTDGAANDGRCFMWNDPRGRRAPWANGPVTNPRDDGKAFVDRYGVNAVNRDIFSIEISGNGNTALSAKARQKVVAWTAYWADQYRVSHETFPAIPGEGGRSFVIWHGEINGGKWGTCPGAVVEGQTNAMIAEVKALLKQYQEGAAVEYAKPQPVESGTRIINDRLFVGVDKAYTIGRQTVPRLWADPSSPATGPALEAGATVTVSHMVEDVGAESGLTLVLADGSRIPALALVAEE